MQLTTSINWFGIITTAHSNVDYDFIQQNPNLFYKNTENVKKEVTLSYYDWRIWNMHWLVVVELPNQLIDTIY